MTRRWFFDRAARLAAAMPLPLALAPGASADERDDDGIDVTPTGMLFVLDGRAYEVLRWSDAQWSALDDDERPAGAARDSDGGYALLRRVADDCWLEGWSPCPVEVAELEVRLAREAMEDAARRFED